MGFNMDEVWRTIVLIAGGVTLMRLIEEYEELVERQAAEISSLWKYIQIFLYLLSTISGYACCVLFYMIQDTIFDGNCPLWATSDLMSEEQSRARDILSMKSIQSHWWNFILTEYKYGIRCKIYLLICFSSCTFGIVWLALFFMCEKGGHATRIFYAPWRIVLPSLSFNFIFTIIVMFAHYNLEQGYKAFTRSIEIVAIEMYNIHNVVLDVSDCGIIKAFINVQHTRVFNVCNIVADVKIFSVLMMWSWILATLLLILRITAIADFRLLKVRIYEIKNE